MDTERFWVVGIMDYGDGEGEGYVRPPSRYNFDAGEVMKETQGSFD